MGGNKGEHFRAVTARGWVSTRLRRIATNDPALGIVYRSLEFVISFAVTRLKSRTTYFLWRAVLGNSVRLPLTKAEYEALRRAWSVLTALLAFEEEWDVLLENYMELELGFLSAAMHSMVHTHGDTNELRQARLGFRRRLNNLLSACRSYLDHAPHHLGALDKATADAFTRRTNEAYDSEFAYRLMEALRNHAQHRGSSLHGTSFNTRWVERDTAESLLQYSVNASVNVSELRADEDFKSRILTDFADHESIDLLAMARIYIENLGKIHSDTRDDVSNLSFEAKALLRKALDRYERKARQSRLGIAFAWSDNDRTVEEFQTIPEDLIEWYESLIARNRNVINLRKRFVTNELLPERNGRPRRR